MSDDELKVWAERQIEDPRSAAVLQLLAERDRLAAELTAIKFAMKHEIDLATKLTERDAELAELKKGEPTDSQLMAAAVDAQRRADNYAKKLGELSTELAELRAAASLALSTKPTERWADHIGRPGDALPTPGCACYSCQSHNHHKARQVLAALLARTPEEGR